MGSYPYYNCIPVNNETIETMALITICHNLERFSGVIVGKKIGKFFISIYFY